MTKRRVSTSRIGVRTCWNSLRNKGISWVAHRRYRSSWSCVALDSALSRFMNAKIICLLAAVSLALPARFFAAGGKTYEMTGTVVAATGTTLALEKGTEKYEFAIDPATIKGSAELKVGSTVTVTYVMSVTRVETAKEAAAASTP